MHHRLRILKEQHALAKQPTLRAMLATNIQQIQSMIDKEPVPQDDRSPVHEVALQILLLEEEGVEE